MKYKQFIKFLFSTIIGKNRFRKNCHCERGLLKNRLLSDQYKTKEENVTRIEKSILRWFGHVKRIIESMKVLGKRFVKGL